MPDHLSRSGQRARLQAAMPVGIFGSVSPPIVTRMMQLSRFPSTALLLAKAAFKTNKQDRFEQLEISDFPSTSISIAQQRVSANRVDKFNRLCGWPSTHEQFLHPCMFHVLAFPLHLTLMLQADFPFKLLGLVHIRNVIQQFRRVRVDETLDVHCRFSSVEKHRKGWVFGLESTVFSGNELVWRSNSYNLYRYQHKVDIESVTPMRKELLGKESTSWRLPEKVGRQYASVSDDYNPIHLFSMAARLFGFRHHIAHGMFNKAHCVSALAGQLGEAFKIDVEFNKPVFLPATVHFCVSPQDNLMLFQLQNQTREELHLHGQLVQGA